MNIAKIMTPKALTVFLHESDSVRKGLEIMRERGYTAIPVLDSEGGYLGCITEGDFLRHILSIGSTDMKDQEKYQIREIFRRDFCPALGINAEYAQVADAAMRQNFVPIVDDRNCLCGIVTRRSVIKYLTERLTPEETATL